MSNKTPFEIRTEILELAQEYVTKQYEANVEFASKTFEMLVAQGKEAQDNFAQYMPKVFTFEDVMEKAREMYSFVSKKD